MVLVSGEPGIGKSRLTAALMERLTSEPHTRLRYFCSPQHTDSAFYPIIGQMERAARLAHDDTPQVKLNKLDALLNETSTSKQDAALFAEMLSLPNDGRYPALDLAPQQRRQRTLEVLTAQLARLASQQPVLMIFEDAHWTDPTSLEVFGRAVDQIKTLPALLIVTFRPEFNAPWVGQPQVTTLTLNRLGERDAAAIVERLVGNKELPADVLAEIVERTDGIPLFVEEMTKAVLEAEGEGEVRRTAGAVPSPTLAVPSSLHASLMARLDRLGPAKEVAQIGSVSGASSLGTVGCGDSADRKQNSNGRWIISFNLDCCSAAGRAAACDVSVQACAGTGRRLLDPVARATAGTARPRRCGTGSVFLRSRRAPAGVARPPSERRRRHRACRRPMAEGGAARGRRPGSCRSNRPFREGSRLIGLAT